MEKGTAVVEYTNARPSIEFSSPASSNKMYRGIAITTPGNIWVTRNIDMPMSRPGKAQRLIA